ncbi:diacylglycerol/lipid kinase family protein [Deinococcus arenicola]|uniref:Diacylglycerol kinase family lipid kinase n=1 Tax=Deinococcus arenicola TaxID=2994950 RepID=A0ABU4DNM0_9DEIO|nr:diacylglycerol kinase family lipid kinase [Deinococcus sp. ZS9-10]MDV6374033.1 diacylglycerol kinase family lipid kinase [Deinococcus sp. ZS9-10]
MTGQTTPPAAPPGSPTSQRILVVFNPKSGSGSGPDLQAFVGLLEDGGATVTQRELSKDTPLPDYVQDVKDFDILVAAGGDGTVSGLTYAVRDQGVPVLAFPAGTANLIAQNLDLPTTAPELAALVLAGHSIQVDLGEIDVRGKKNGFAMLAGAGADAAMIEGSEDLKDKFGVMAYVISAMKQLNPKKTTFKLTIDGEQREFEGIGVMVANFGMANFRMPITTDIDPDDGKFTVVLLKAGNLLRLIPNLIDSVRAKLHLGDPMFSDNMETLTACEITVDAADPFPLQYDGELMVETTPFTARILVGAALFITAATAEEVET